MEWCGPPRNNAGVDVSALDVAETSALGVADVSSVSAEKRNVSPAVDNNHTDGSCASETAIEAKYGALWSAASASSIAARSRLEMLADVLLTEISGYLSQRETLGVLYHTSRRLRAHVVGPGGTPHLSIDTPEKLEGALLLLSPAALRHVRTFRIRHPVRGRWPPTLARLLGTLGPHLRVLDLQERVSMGQKAIVAPAVWPALEELLLVLSAAPMFVDQAPAVLPALGRLSLHSLTEAAVHASGMSCRALNFLRAAPAPRLRALHLHLSTWTNEFERELARLAPGLESLRIELRPLRSDDCKLVRLPPLPRVRSLSLSGGGSSHSGGGFEMSGAPHPELRHLLLRGASVDVRIAAGMGLEPATLDAPKLQALTLPANSRCAADVRKFASAGALEHLGVDCMATSDVSCDCVHLAGVLGGAAFTGLRDVRADLHETARHVSAFGALLALPQLVELYSLAFDTRPPDEWWAAQRIGTSLCAVTFAYNDCPRPPSLPPRVSWGSVKYAPVTQPWPHR